MRCDRRLLDDRMQTICMVVMERVSTTDMEMND